MTYQLRDYQLALILDIERAWELGHRSVMLQLPTGGGKTICFSHLVQTFLANGRTCLILAHREELILQAAAKIHAITDTTPGIIKAKYKPNYNSPIQVASIQSLTRRLAKCPHPDLIVIDEAHHSAAKTYRTVLEHFPNSQILGVTATPVRLDGKGFRDMFDDLVSGVSVKQLIEMGSLSTYKYFVPERSMSIVGVRKKGGDYRTADLAAANDADTVAADCVKAYRDYLQDKQAVIFAINIEQSRAIACSFQANGIAAAHLDGESDSTTRSLTMEAFRDGTIQVLTNCALFDEGLDIPGLDGVILARPTASLGRYLQMVGRALRPAEGKEHARIIDLAGNWERHGLPCDDRVWSLDGVKTKPRGNLSQLQRKEDGQIEEVTIDLTPSNIQLREITPQLDLDGIWQIVLDRLLPADRALFEYGFLTSIDNQQATIAMKSPTILRIALISLPRLKTALSEVLDFPVIPKLEMMIDREKELFEWLNCFKQICSEQQTKGYKPSWIGFRLAELKPPLEVWVKAETYLGYKRGWAHHKFREQQE